ncbi:MAG: hydrogenase maturation nickel metallochaperone HypA [Chloroflexi bacterium]|nr:hydrogenase maturation nickel metallochaperone HypA [Chloroflexota bacterium]
MHESGLTEDLFAHALQHAREANARRIARIKVVIGALSDATAESIQFCFDSLAPGTIAEGATIEFGTSPGEAHCNGVAAMIRDVCLLLREQRGMNEVALSGGVFQNMTLLGKTLGLVRGAGFEVLTHRLVPPNDGGIALGQAVIAARLGEKV